MNTTDLCAIGAGFLHSAHESQAVFRAALQALSLPGRPVDVMHVAQVPPHVNPASAALLLALLDSDCRLWMSASLAGSDAAAWLRFHTGCMLVDQPAQAHFAWAAHPDELPSIAALAQGSDAYPDQSGTCVIDVPVLVGGAGACGDWILRGPGIREQVRLRVEGLSCDFGEKFVTQWAANHAAFPRGADVFLATPQQIVGLPRTTRIEREN